MATIWSCVALGQQVAGELLDDELVVGQVAVEGADHPVAVEPDRARLVLLVAVASRRSGRRRASAGPSARRSAARRAAARPASVQASGLRVGQERVDLLERRRQADQVEAEPAQQRDAVGRGEAARPSFSSRASTNRSMGCVHAASPAGAGRDVRAARRPSASSRRWSDRRAVGPRGPFVDPLAQQGDLRLGQRRLLEGHARLVCLRPAARWIRRLSALCPGAITFRAVLFASKRVLPRGFSPAWQV